MKGHLKNIAILFLFVVIMAPISFAFLSYHIQLKLIKREVKQQLIQATDRSDLVAFTFNLNSTDFKSLRWEHDREFELNHKMFDIVEADTIGNIVHYLCFPDKQETALNLVFNKKLANRYAKDQFAKNRANQMLSLIYGIYFIPFQEEHEANISFITKKYGAYSKIFIAVSLDFPAPPPKLFN
jgi:hypothetical protein